MNRFVIADAGACIGCRACEVACVLSHNAQRYPSREAFLPRIQVIKQDEIQSAVLCRHCEDAPCLRVCPTAALVRSDDSVQVIEELCIGCKTCVVACPFGAITVVRHADSQPGTGWPPAATAHKCDLCLGDPKGQACVNACPTQALHLITSGHLERYRAEKQRRSALADGTHRPAPRPPVKHALLTGALNPPRLDATKKPLDERKSTFNEIYQGFSPVQVEQQADRCIRCSEKPFCAWTCPLHNDIPELLSLAKQGRILEAVELSHRTSSLPEVCGRVCPQDRLCEGACTLEKQGSVSVGNIERYITDAALALGWKPDLSAVIPRGYRVAIVGAGPAGLACADVLARQGVKAVVYDRHPEIGGLLTFGIPAFKLDKSVLARRREIFTEMGIEFRLNVEIGADLSAEQLLEEFDAVFLGVGTYQSLKAGLENEDAPGVYSALPFLIANAKHLMGLPELSLEPYVSMSGKRVVVLGGGDTAMDCLRTSVRQNAKSVICAYRRDEKNMPGSKKEVKNSREEGAEFMFNVQPVSIELTEEGHVCGIRLIRTALGEPDASGRRRPKPITGSEFLLEADAIIMAFGFQPHAMPWLDKLAVERDNWGLLNAPARSRFPYQTSHPHIFAGGDAVRGADLVVTAIDDGRQAAISIIHYLDSLSPAAATSQPQGVTAL
ncbi:formate-dependent uric acid utilization protein AegA [Rahnella woolbedingensis]|uniref:Oxidoreductase FeS-binding subunit n=1 Tax=Rahnella woolbedingensis TaxID=1510574 RepID=A0A419N608_9GAMM|nr:formate-dependent uric acid utilization protein AegA [Rahnella woolbedingensis]RJT42240.1 oxidoreductase FeS-binding subunit [Rahnella woolbedingensis]